MIDRGELKRLQKLGSSRIKGPKELVNVAGEVIKIPRSMRPSQPDSQVGRIWIWGDRSRGYSVVPSGKKRWLSEVWDENVRWRTDDHKTKEAAIKFARQRKAKFYGRMTPAQSKAKYSRGRR